MQDPTTLQREYYRKTALQYDSMHVSAKDENALALRYVAHFCDQYHLKTVLDVGCGTGRALAYLREKGVLAEGIEPVKELFEAGKKTYNLPSEILHLGNADQLPFPDKSFDAISEFSVFHHIKDTKPAILEMMRVARHAIFLSDENRFGRGSLLWRLTKLAWWKLGVFNLGFWIMTKGKGYNKTEEDGISYSYSVYDSYPLLAEWADSILLIPLKGTHSPRWAHPLLNSTHVLLCAFRHPEAKANNP